MSYEEYKQQTMEQFLHEKDGCSKPLMYAFIIAALVLCMCCSCVTKKSTESSVDIHRMSLMTERMDSLLHATSTWQQSIYEKQTSLVDSFKQSEVRDTSRVIFLGAAGDTIREKIVIREYIEREHTSEESTKESYEERFRQTDSLLQVSIAKQEKSDSLLHEYQKATVVEKKESLTERLFGGVRNFLAFFCVLLLIFLYWRLKRK